MNSFQLSDDQVVVVKKTVGQLMVTIKHKEDNNKYIELTPNRLVK